MLNFCTVKIGNVGKSIIYLNNNQIALALPVLFIYLYNNQINALVPVNTWQNHVSSELLYKSNRPQGSMVYRHDKPLGMFEEHLRNP